MDAHSPTPIRRPEAEPLADVIEGGGLPRGPALPRELDGVGIAPNAVVRAIEDLHAERVPAAACAPGPAGALVDPAGGVAPDATCETEKRQSLGEASPGGGGRDMTLAMVAMWVLVGLLVGLLAGLVMKAGGYGRRWDILLALVGSVVWSGIAWLLGIPLDPGLVAVTIVAFVGAAGLIVAQRKIWPIIVRDGTER